MLTFTKLRDRLKALFCEHRCCVYDPPVLRIDNQGSPYVESRYYCDDCGAGLPMPDYHDEHEAHRLLMAYKVSLAGKP